MSSNNPYHRIETQRKVRNIDLRVDDLIASRWSPRAFSPEKIPEKDIMTIIDAARLAPSSNNNQPWIIIYAHRETKEWEELFNTLADGNKSWVKNASALFVFVSYKFDNKKRPIYTASFDTGAFWMSFALQSHKMNYGAHGMAGFNYDAIYALYGISKEHFKVEAMAVIGIIDKPSTLSKEYQQSEITPSERKSINEVSLNANRAKETFARINT